MVLKSIDNVNIRYWLYKLVDREINGDKMEVTRKLPALITNSIDRLDLTRTNKLGPLLYSLHHFDEETGRTKQKRADRRNSIIKVLQVILPQMDLDTLTWGQFFTRHDGKTDFYTRGLDYVSDKACMNHKTVSRVMSDLEKCGYLRVKRTAGMGKAGKEIRHYSLRTFTHKFFRELGFKSRTIETSRAWKRKKNEITFYKQKATTKCLQGLGKIAQVFNTQLLKKKKVYKTMKMPSQKISPTDTSNLLHKASDIADRTGRSFPEVYKELVSKQ